MDDYQILLDAPDRPHARVQIAKLGDDFTHAAYGDFQITAENVANWQRNLAHLPGQRALIDLDHQADRKPRKTEAAGWITGVELEDGVPMADVEWTPVGQQAIAEKRYLFFSPTYGPFTDERGTVHDDTLVGGALTNKPHLAMPTISLASPERITEALDADPAERFHRHALDGQLGEHAKALVLLDVDADERKLALKEGNSLPDGSYPIRNTAQLHSAAILAASGHGNAAAAKKLIARRAKQLGVDVKTLPGFDAGGSDSPTRKMDSATLIKTLDLPEDADDTQILEKLEELKTPVEPVEPQTLEAQASEAGKVLLDADQFNTLKVGAEAGASAAKELAEQKFENAFQRALDTGRAVAGQKDDLQHFYTLDAERTLKQLAEGPQIVNVKPIGHTYAVDSSVPDGVHPESHERHVKVLARARENNVPYMTALDQITAEEKGEV